MPKQTVHKTLDKLVSESKSSAFINASASAFEWDFQSNAAIMLMLKNIEKASKVKVEGQSEDVEIGVDARGELPWSRVKPGWGETDGAKLYE
ncbi:MAG: hypothetical protein VB100_08970 [Angelakisella sp.]|nr:hypothetical protein [Angelakisella sp.]